MKRRTIDESTMNDLIALLSQIAGEMPETILGRKAYALYDRLIPRCAWCGFVHGGGPEKCPK